MFDSIYPIPAFTDNYIWALVDSQRQQACVVDPGDAEPVLAYLAAQNLTLTQILITHHHPDHTGGLARLTDKFAPIVYGPANPGIRGITHPLNEGDSADVLGLKFSVIEVPGHTLDHIAYFSDSTDQPTLFCGDTLFAAGCGRLFEGTPEQMLVSLGKLSSLPNDTLVYCTHEYTLANLKFALTAEPGNTELQKRNEVEMEKRANDEPTLPSNITRELATNPFLRCEQPEIRKNVSKQSAQELSDQVATFAALRQWKDNF